MTGDSPRFRLQLFAGHDREGSRGSLTGSRIHPR